jgi:hypothetical protein
MKKMHGHEKDFWGTMLMILAIVGICMLFCFPKGCNGAEGQNQKPIQIWSNVYLGFVPGHQLSMYKIPYQQEILDINQTLLSEFIINFNLY